MKIKPIIEQQTLSGATDNTITLTTDYDIDDLNLYKIR